ncbi:MAG: S49 family peptidase, partial [Vicinamibacteria bacterium]
MLRKPFTLIAVVLGLLAFAPSGFGQFDFLKKLSKQAVAEEKPAKQIAYFKLKGALEETPTAMPPLFGGEPSISLKSLLERFKKARKDDNVVAVVLDLQNAAIGAAQLEELHASLRKFAVLDKQILVHADSLSTGTYAAASGASHISIVPTGDLWLTGLYGEQLYLRGTFDKIGATPDFEQCGDFKTATETFMRSGPSPQAEQMTKWLLDGLFDGVVKLIAEGRSLPADKVRALIDGGPYSAEEALSLGLIDSVQHRQDFVAGIEKRFGEDVDIVADYGKDDEFEIPEENFFAMMEFFMKMLNPKEKEYTEPSVAIVYVDGAITTGEAEKNPFASSEGAFSTTIRRALDEAADDDTVKAVVLRVDSPGGSALASEIILDASARVAKKKPLIVSMGNV